jgi:hypothetical protein
VLPVKGEVIYLYAFDVASEIVTSRVQQILAKKPFPFVLRTDRPFPKDVPVYAPLTIEPPASGARMAGKPVRSEIRVYEVGVVTITLRVGFEVANLLELLPFHRATLEDGRTLDRIAQEICAEVCKGLQESMVRRSEPSEPEAYTVFSLTELPNVKNVNTWFTEHRREGAGLLSESDPTRLSELQVTEALRIQRSYDVTDLAIIDWDAALSIDLTGYVDDVLYVLELANVQLEEFRVMDRRLDGYYDRLYDYLERRRFPYFGVASPTLAALRRFRVDLAKLADEVTHITKFFGDWYLARVYLGARDRFYLDQWRRSVEERLSQLDQLYSVVHSEVYERRMLWLEIIIVFLFVVDVLGLFFWKR